MSTKPHKIRVTENMIINDMGIERVSNFFCEFDNDGDPLYGEIGANPQVHRRFDHWWIGETDLSFTVELDGIYEITDIYLYNEFGDHAARVRMGTPFKWEFDKEFTPKMQEWCGFKAGANTQYINFTFNNTSV